MVPGWVWKLTSEWCDAFPLNQNLFQTKSISPLLLPLPSQRSTTEFNGLRYGLRKWPNHSKKIAIALCFSQILTYLHFLLFYRRNNKRQRRGSQSNLGSLRTRHRLPNSRDSFMTSNPSKSFQYNTTDIFRPPTGEVTDSLMLGCCHWIWWRADWWYRTVLCRLAQTIPGEALPSPELKSIIKIKRGKNK